MSLETNFAPSKAKPTEHLFERIRLGRMTLPHRVAMAPLTRSRARQPGNVPTPLNAAYYVQRACAAVIISEATQVSMQGQGYAWTPGIHSREQIESWRLVTDAVRAAGGRIFLQLWHVGRIFPPRVATGRNAPRRNGLKIANLVEPTHVPPRYNAAPGQEHWVIRQNPMTGERTLDRLSWGLIPHWCKDEDGGRKPINAKAETVAQLPSFRDAYRHRRCIAPIDNFFEWRAIKGSPKQPYAIGMKSGKPFALAGIWENWKRPETEEWVRTFAIITTNSNELVSAIHDRMPVIIAPEDYTRWLSPLEPDPRDLLVPYPAEPMTM